MNSTVTLIGNLTHEPEVRATNGGSLTRLGLAVNRRWPVNGGWENRVSYFSVVTWGTLADNVATSLHKGDRVIVNGRLEQSSWQTEEQRRSTVEVVADEVGPSLRWATAEPIGTSRPDLVAA